MTLSLFIRYILDYDGPFDGVCPTHVACKEHGTDFLTRTLTLALALTLTHS